MKNIMLATGFVFLAATATALAAGERCVDNGKVNIDGNALCDLYRADGSKKQNNLVCVDCREEYK